MIAHWLLLIQCLLIASPSDHGGAITGTVLNTSSGNAPLSRAEVMLRASVRGEDLICGQTITDDQGRFAFDKLPLGMEYVYLPGANRDGVHYPGPRLRLTPAQPRARVELQVCDAISAPSPLVIRRQEISIRAMPGVLMVTESLSIANPSSRCYVGPKLEENGEPITLQLAIPSNFQQTTFFEEFFGRRFTVLNGKLATSIPWPPGERNLKFTYTAPIEQGFCRWRRPLDLPCELIRVSVQADDAGEVHCNLPAVPGNTAGELVFQSSGEILPSGFVIQVEMGRLPVPLMSYARWIALAVLLFLLVAIGILSLRRIRPAPEQQKHDKHSMRLQTRKSKAA